MLTKTRGLWGRDWTQLRTKPKFNLGRIPWKARVKRWTLVRQGELWLPTSPASTSRLRLSMGIDKWRSATSRSSGSPWACDVNTYRIYSNKRRVAYLIFRATSAALIRGRRLFKHRTRQIYFFYIFIQRYTFYLLIFLWTDTKLIVNLELREKFTRWKKPVVEQFTTFSQRKRKRAYRPSGEIQSHWTKEHHI